MQMVSDVPIGAFLSGGIDSSAVVALHGAHSDRPVKTYAIGFDGGAAEAFYNELPYARRVAELLRHRASRDPRQARTSSRCCRGCCGTWTSRSPTRRSSRRIWCRSSRARDVTVILSGVGGDELFGGYRRYLGNHYQAYFDRLPAWAAARPRSALAGALPSDRHSPLLNAIAPRQGLPGERRACRSRSAIASYVEVFPRDDGGRAAARAGRRGARRPDRGRVPPMRRATTTLNRMLAVDAETQLPDDLLLLTDKMSMAVSLECRVPLLDHELVELAARMPQDDQDPRRPAEARA